MSDTNNGYNNARRSDVAYTRYSRDAGVSGYRRKRRQGRVFRFVVGLLLIAVIGGAGFLLGRSHWDVLKSLGAPAADADAQDAEETITTVQPVEITLLATGDVIMNGTVAQSGLQESGAYDYAHVFRHLTPELSLFDMRMVSQETNLPGSKFGFGYTRPLNAAQELGRDEVNAGFNIILRATDHTMDNGTEGIHNELSWWKSEFEDLPVLGIAEPNHEENPGLSDYVNNVYVFEKDGFKVAVLNHTWGVSDENRGFISALVEDKVASDVAKAREAGADMIVACPHWGIENSTELSEEETTFAQIYADQGVDVVIGTNPRVLQRVEVLDGPDGHKTVCYYSLGCLISSLYTQNLIGGVAEVTLARDDTGACSVRSAVLKPTITHRANGDDYTVYLLSSYSDNLAHSSWDYSMTPEEISRSCTEILGDGYDAEAEEYRVQL